MMSSIINKHESGEDFKNSALYEKLLKKSNKLLLESNLDLEYIYKELCRFLNHKLQDDYFFALTRSWIGAVKFMGIVDKANISKEQEQWIDPILSAIKTIKSKTNLWQENGAIIDLYSMLTDSEIEYECIFQPLDEFKDIINTCLDDMSFGRGGKYSKGELQRYGVYSLLEIGEEIGLRHAGKPSSLYEFVRIITELEPKDISNYYTEYKKIIMTEAIKNNNVLRCIYPRTTIIQELKANPISLGNLNFR